MRRGYSDSINHAFAFAAKHHDQQVRKGTRLPYLTQPANIAVILTRYGQDDDTVLGGILYDVIEDSVRPQFRAAMLEDRLREKFGDDVVDAALMVIRRDADDSGEPLSHEEQTEDYVSRLGKASPRALWIAAAQQIHGAGSIIADLQRTADQADRDAIWRRFRRGKAGTVADYHAVHSRLREVGFNEPILQELGDFVGELERWAGSDRPTQSEVATPAADNLASSPLP